MRSLKLASGDGLIRPIALDVTVAESRSVAVDRIIRECGCVDILVNNAGIHRLGAFEDMPEKDLRLTMETNFFGVVGMTREVLPQMRARRAGHIVMMSSVGALISRATDAFYCASKSALEAASEALRHEVARFGIHVSVIEPGVFRTEIAEKGAEALFPLQDSPYAELMKFRGDKVREACRGGDDPAVLAQLAVSVAHTPPPYLRHPAGTQAQALVAALRAVDADGRDRLIRDKSQVDWWIDGRADPDR
jgi:NAD(P)-dependent dehydrogenase (short-subunit alcohol dehydrogenase family)